MPSKPKQTKRGSGHPASASNKKGRKGPAEHKEMTDEELAALVKEKIDEMGQQRMLRSVKTLKNARRLEETYNQLEYAAEVGKDYDVGALEAAIEARFHELTGHHLPGHADDD